MTEIITKTRAEEAVADTNNFLNKETGYDLDGSFAAEHLSARLQKVKKLADDLILSLPYPKSNGFYIPISKYNADRFSEAAVILPGHFLLVPGSFVEEGSKDLYPAVVSEDGIKNDDLRLHVLKQPYLSKINYATSIILSAAGQSETKATGEHGRTKRDSLEAEHFLAILALNGDKDLQETWKSGKHINHDWRNHPSNSVTTEMYSRLFGSSIPQTTITITKRQIELGKAMLLWHEGMREPTSGKPDTADKDNALVMIQGLGYLSLVKNKPRSINKLKRLISG